jgi:integral membrane protein
VSATSRRSVNDAPAATGAPSTKGRAVDAGLTPRRFYLIVAIAEAVTWTGLIAGMLLKYLGGIDFAVTITGTAHGIVFVTYAGTAIIVGLNQRWPLARIAFGVLTAIVPYATIPFDRWLDRRGHLDGAWRTERSDDPRDASWMDAAMRWFLARPALLAGAFVVAVAAIVAVLLLIGPPGGSR